MPPRSIGTSSESEIKGEIVNKLTHGCSYSKEG